MIMLPFANNSLHVPITFVARQHHRYLGQILFRSSARRAGTQFGLQYLLPQTDHLLERFARVHAENQHEKVTCRAKKQKKTTIMTTETIRENDKLFKH